MARERNGLPSFVPLRAALEYLEGKPYILQIKYIHVVQGKELDEGERVRVPCGLLQLQALEGAVFFGQRDISAVE